VFPARSYRRFGVAAVIAVALMIGLLPTTVGAERAPFNGLILYYGSGNTLWSFDPDSGARNQIAALTSDGSIGRPAWSPDGQRIAYGSGPYGESVLRIVSASGSGDVAAVSGLDARNPVWSPDGTRIAFVGNEDPQYGSNGVYIADATGANPQLVSPEDDLYSPRGTIAWSNDGTKIAFTNYEGSIFTMTPRGTEITEVTSSVYLPARSVDFDPSGSMIVFDTGGLCSIHTIEVGGGTPQQVGCGSYPVWSPDGRYILAGDENSTTATPLRAFRADSGREVDLNLPTAHEPYAHWQGMYVNRLAGEHRISTAVATSMNSFPEEGSANAVVLARSDHFPDALAGAPLAYAKGGPLLLTTGNSLHEVTGQELREVLPRGRTVFLLGGTSALSTNVEAQVRALGYNAVRLGGVHRFHTAQLIAEHGLGGPRNVFLADGLSFQDALIAGPAAARRSAAILLTNGAGMQESTATYLRQHPERRIALHELDQALRTLPASSALQRRRTYYAELLERRLELPRAEQKLVRGRYVADSLRVERQIANLAPGSNSATLAALEQERKALAEEVQAIGNNALERRLFGFARWAFNIAGDLGAPDAAKRLAEVSQREKQKTKKTAPVEPEPELSEQQVLESRLAVLKKQLDEALSKRDGLRARKVLTELQQLFPTEPICWAGAGTGATGLAPTEVMRSAGAAGTTDRGAPGEPSWRSIELSSTVLGGFGLLSAPASAMLPKPAPRTAPPATVAFQVSERRMGILSSGVLGLGGRSSGFAVRRGPCCGPAVRRP